MFRFFQRLGCCNCCNPTTDVLTAEDHRLLVSEREGLDANTHTHVSHGFQHGLQHSNTTSKPVTPQDSTAGPPLPSNSQIIEQGIDTTLRDTHHSCNCEDPHAVSGDQQNVNGCGAEYIDPELIRFTNSTTTQVATQAQFQSLPSNSQVVEQGIGAILQDAHHFNISGNVRFVNIGQQNVNNRGTYDLNSLKEFVSFNALHDSSAQDPERRCHPGTRKNVLHKMRTWIDDSNAPERILWLHGPAGVGKSAIAQTISYSYGRDKVGASFFFFRSDPMRNDGNRFFPTLAWRLASSVPMVKDLIAFALEEDPDLPRKAIEAQFDQLIAQPFLTISGGEPSTLRLSRVVIIDGLDECSDVKLQRRILKIIGNATIDTHFPLRFIISSRPEAHIEDFFSQLEHPTLQIDLANVDDAYRDIETYLMSELARIAVEQGLDPEVWPGQDSIDTLVSNSSGQFVYASTIIKYAGDEYDSAVARLNVILGLKPSAGQSPFSELDSLYTEVLRRQPDQNFLKEFFPVLVARSMLSDVRDGNLHKDDAVLLGLEETQLHRKLRGMRSILKFEPSLDVHHKSFLDFLQDSSRSGEYHVSKPFANRQYMQRIVDVLVRDACKVMEQPNFHGSDHFQPRFAQVIQKFPLKIELPLNDLEEISQPLLVIQEKLLRLPSMSVPWKPRACEDCWTFYIIDDLLLHVACFRGATQQEPKYVGFHLLTPIEERQNIPPLNLDACLSLLLAELRTVESLLSLNADTIGLVRALIRFDPTETAMKVRSIMDAQNLVELIFCLNKECFQSWFGAAAHSTAMRLALAVYGRMPLLPRSLFLNCADLDQDKGTFQGKPVKIWSHYISVWRDCFEAFMWGNVSHDNMVPCLGIYSQSGIMMVSPSLANEMSNKWWRSTNPSISKIQAMFFEVAKGIQYIHSFGIAFGYEFDAEDIYLDSDSHVKLQCPYFQPNDLCKGRFDYDDIGRNIKFEDDIRQFGLVFYQALFDEISDVIPKTHPNKPEIPNNLWELMEWCSTDNPKERPTMDQVVQEMESWISFGQFTLLL